MNLKATSLGASFFDSALVMFVLYSSDQFLKTRVTCCLIRDVFEVLVSVQMHRNSNSRPGRAHSASVAKFGKNH